MIDTPAGIAMAVEVPCSARAASSISGLVAKPPSSEAAANRTSPDRNSLRRPKRSANRPNISMVPAAGSVYAETIQGSPVNLNPTPAPTFGSATFRIE